MLEDPELRAHFKLDESLEDIHRQLKVAILQADPHAPVEELAAGLVLFKQESRELAAATAEILPFLLDKDLDALRQLCITFMDRDSPAAAQIDFTVEVIDCCKKIKAALIELAMSTGSPEVRAVIAAKQKEMANAREDARQFAERHGFGARKQ